MDSRKIIYFAEDEDGNLRRIHKDGSRFVAKESKGCGCSFNKEETDHQQEEEQMQQQQEVEDIVAGMMQKVDRKLQQCNETIPDGYDTVAQVDEHLDHLQEINELLLAEYRKMQDWRNESVESEETRR